jgi:small subunit ribosomal protein S8
MDPITDMLNRLVNAQAVNHPTVDIPFSNLKYKILEILERNKFIEKVDKKGRKTDKTATVTLRYVEKQPGISGFKRISKPGQKIYASWHEIRKVRSGYGISIVSTSKGLMVGPQARKQKIGGEILFEIW